MPARVVFVEDEAPFRRFAGSYLEESGFEVTYADTAAAGLAAVEATSPDLVLLDLNLPDLGGLEVLRRIKAADAAARVIVLTAMGDAPTAVTALKAGAVDYLTKPVQLERLAQAAREALEAAAPAAPEGRPPATPPARGGEEAELVGQHPAWGRLLERLERAARAEVECVLLLGESGTGKSALARRYHRLGSRAAGPFVEIDCPSIPDALLESELFGHERGAFTGATARKRGQLELAAGGTLFLDEIGELPLSLQPKLLRFLEQRRFRRVGGLEDITADVRLVCATNRDLERDVAGGAFRQDLYYRLAIVALRVPPLRERGDDVVHLARHFATAFALRNGRTPPRLAPEAERALRAHAFPGNIRELRNTIQRAVAFLDGDTIEPGDLELGGAPAAPAGEQGPAPAAVDAEALLDAIEAIWIELALQATDSQRDAAARLGIDRFALARRMSRVGRAGGRAVAETILAAAPAWARELLGPPPTSLPAGGLDLPGARRAQEAQLIAHVLRATGGNRARAAGLLGMSRTSLGRRLDGD